MRAGEFTTWRFCNGPSFERISAGIHFPKPDSFGLCVSKAKSDGRQRQLSNA